MTIANKETLTVSKVCRNLNIKIAGEIFHIPTIYQQENGMDIILGYNFCQLYAPFTQFTDRIIFTLDNQPVIIGKIRKAITMAQPGFLSSMKKNSKIPTPTPIPVTSKRINFLDGGMM
jgi:hypothetical protein